MVDINKTKFILFGYRLFSHLLCFDEWEVWRIKFAIQNW